MNDTKTENRICKVCNQVLDYNKPDPCLGYLPGVKFACCGHGDDNGGYIMFENDIAIYFDTQEIINWNSFNEDTPLDPETGGVWTSDLDSITFKDEEE